MTRLARIDDHRLFLALGGQRAPVARQLRQQGLAALGFSARYGPAYDYRSPTVRDVILGWIRAGIVSGLILHVDHPSWSKRYAPGVRSSAHPWGVPNLSGRYLQQVQDGNADARASLAVLREGCG